MQMCGMSIITDTLKRITVNPTELCNRICPFCPRGDPEVYPNRSLHMTRKTAGKIGTDMRDINFKGELFIAGFGEPLLHKNIPEIINHMTNINTLTCVTVVTNGDKLNTRCVDELIDAGVTNIIISMYDDSQQQEKLSDIINGSLPVVYRERYYSIGDTNDYGIENINNRAGLVKGRTVTEPIKKTCYIPFNKCQIDWNGDMLLCDQDWSRKGIIGNIHQTSIGDMWLSEKIERYRTKLINSNRCLSPCDKCDVTGDVYGKESYDKLKQYYEDNNSR